MWLKSRVPRSALSRINSTLPAPPPATAKKSAPDLLRCNITAAPSQFCNHVEDRLCVLPISQVPKGNSGR